MQRCLRPAALASQKLHFGVSTALAGNDLKVDMAWCGKPLRSRIKQLLWSPVYAQNARVAPMRSSVPTSSLASVGTLGVQQPHGHVAAESKEKLPVMNVRTHRMQWRASAWRSQQDSCLGCHRPETDARLVYAHAEQQEYRGFAESHKLPTGWRLRDDRGIGTGKALAGATTLATRPPGRGTSGHARSNATVAISRPSDAT
jgi:hypothetical protein